MTDTPTTKSKPLIITLIRHGETTANLARILQGVADAPLTVFGQAQVDALAATFGRTLAPSADQAASSLGLPAPTLVVCSPIGRARKTAEAIHAACQGTEVHGLAPDATAGARLNTARKLMADELCLLVDHGLKEKDFGRFESTRSGSHVPGFEKGTGKGEDKAEFKNRVHRIGLEWLHAACALSNKVKSESEAAEREEHILLVSHGMWIASFLSLHPPTLIKESSGQPGYLPFAANTGIYSMTVERSSSDRIKTTLIKANDTRHLANVKRKKGGIGRGAFDSKQTKLSGFFTPSPNKKRKLDDSDPL